MFVCSQCGESNVDAGFCPIDGSALADNRADPFLGTLVGSYRVASLLGVGGMGRVYKGVNPSIGSRVAIKVLNQDSAQNPEMVERFFAEARAVNLIRHEGIVNIIDLTILPDRRPCIIMEYLDGAALSSIMRGGIQLPLGSFLKSMVEVLSALAAAHQKSVVHRDLKPDNIIVSPQGKAKILDFGIAKLSLADSGLEGPTREGAVLGTPHYMSPEQAAGRTVDHRSDIYSIGIVLFEGVLGQCPFTGNTLYQLLRQHVEDDPPCPSFLRPGIPRTLELAILKALAKDPGARQQSAEELSAQLWHCTQELPANEWAPLLPTIDSHAATSPVAIVEATSSQQSSVQDARNSEPHAVLSYTKSVPGEKISELVEPRRGMARRAIVGGIAFASAGLVVGALVWQSQRESASPQAAKKEVSLDPPPRIGLHDAAPIDSLLSGSERNTLGVARRIGGADAAVTEVSRLGDISMRTSIIADPESIDLEAFGPDALKRAQAVFPDAQLVISSANGVSPDGTANLLLDPKFYVQYNFVSPSQIENPDLPIGVTTGRTCMYIVLAQMHELSAYGFGAPVCNTNVLGPPQCTYKEVWQRAIAQGAPANGAVATIARVRGVTGNVWDFSIGGIANSVSIADDCDLPKKTGR